MYARDVRALAGPVLQRLAIDTGGHAIEHGHRPGKLEILVEDLVADGEVVQGRMPDLGYPQRRAAVGAGTPIHGQGRAPS